MNKKTQTIKYLFIYLSLLLICFSSYLYAQKADRKKEISFIQEGNPFYIHKTDSLHLGFPDLIRLPGKKFMIVYRQGNKHADNSGKILVQYGSKDGLTWSKADVYYDLPGIDERDMSLTLLNNKTIALNCFSTLHSKDTSKPSRILTYFAKAGTKDFRVDTNSIRRFDDINLNDNYTFDKEGFWLNSKNQRFSYYGVSSPVVQIKDELIIAAYGNNHLVKKPSENNKQYSRIIFFKSHDNGHSWTKYLINPEKNNDIRLQEPCLLNIDNKRVIMHIRTQHDRKYSLKDKMMQAISEDAGKSWSDWKEFNFVGHAPYLYKLSNGIILSAYRDFNPETGKEGGAFIFSLDEGRSWSEPIVFDEPRVDNDSSYPSIQQIDKKRFLMVYYTDNGKAIKGIIYKLNN